MVRVYGYSDDNVVIDGSKYDDDEIGCFDCYVRIWFDDGAIIQVSYGKGGKGIWKICVERKGSGNDRLIDCDDEDADIYSDVYETNAEIVRHEVIDIGR